MQIDSNSLRPKTKEYEIYGCVMLNLSLLDTLEFGIYWL